MLGTALQEKWLEGGFLKSRRQSDLLGFECEKYIFDGWHTVMHKEVLRLRDAELGVSSAVTMWDNTNYRTLRSRLETLMLASQIDDGAYYDCPALPGFQSYIRLSVTSLAISSVLEIALKAAIDEVEESGLAAVQKYLPVRRLEKGVQN
jgi:hypothetical protein